MRYGLLADVHANLFALRAAVRAVRAHGVDRWIVAGDLVGYGAQPNECVEEIAALDPVCVAGNHDLIVLGRLSTERCAPLARDSLEWTRGVISEDARAYLDSLPLRADAEGVVVAHGSIDDPQEYTLSAEQARRQLDEIAGGRPEARALVLGHTHRRWAFAADRGTLKHARRVDLGSTGPVLLNPGAVGQSRDVRSWARAGIIDLEAGTAHLLAMRYDVGACRAALRGAGLPPDSCHIRPSTRRITRRILRAAARRVR